jgi:hypothetical protein
MVTIKYHLGSIRWTPLAYVYIHTTLQCSAQGDLAAQPLIDGITTCAVLTGSSGRSRGVDLTRPKVWAQLHQPRFNLE